MKNFLYCCTIGVYIRNDILCSHYIFIIYYIQEKAVEWEKKAKRLEAENTKLNEEKRRRNNRLRDMKKKTPEAFTDEDAVQVTGCHLLSKQFFEKLKFENQGRVPNTCKLVNRKTIHPEHYRQEGNRWLHADGKEMNGEDFCFVFFNSENPTWEYHYCLSKTIKK